MKFKGFKSLILIRFQLEYYIMKNIWAKDFKTSFCYLEKKKNISIRRFFLND
jgi:hypothetical protein